MSLSFSDRTCNSFLTLLNRLFEMPLFWSVIQVQVWLDPEVLATSYVRTAAAATTTDTAELASRFGFAALFAFDVVSIPCNSVEALRDGHAASLIGFPLRFRLLKDTIYFCLLRSKFDTFPCLSVTFQSRIL